MARGGIIPDSLSTHQKRPSSASVSISPTTHVLTWYLSTKNQCSKSTPHHPTT